MENHGTTIHNLLSAGRKALEAGGAPNARRNAEWLLMSVVGGSLLDLIVGSDRPVAAEQVERYRTLITRRAAREPLQYLVGDTSFMSGRFHIEPGVFIPRPDTERLVEVTVQLLGGRTWSGRILDLCCGSGVIGISLAAMLPGARITGLDSSRRAVELARGNADLNDVGNRNEFVTAAAADFRVAEEDRFDAVVCNPPYIPSEDIGDLPPEVKDHEPLEALDGGPDGLDFYRDMVPRLHSWLRPGGLSVFEIGADQSAAVTALMAAAGFEQVTTHQDYQRLDRVISGHLSV
jgi:release factor glutamine methyltransferase